MSAVSRVSVEIESSEFEDRVLVLDQAARKSRSWTIRLDSSWSRSPMVRSTTLRFVITSPISWSRSASVWVTEPVLRSRPSMLLPSPWKTWMIS